MTTHWACTAGHTGSYDAATAPKTDRALPDAKHIATCKAALVTGTDASSLARVVERMRGVAVL
jgi:hypothetical protein